MTNTVGYEMRIESIKGWDKHLTPISPRSGCPEEGHLLPNSHAIIKFVTLYCQCLNLNWMSESSISGHRNIGENLQGVSEASHVLELHGSGPLCLSATPRKVVTVMSTRNLVASSFQLHLLQQTTFLIVRTDAKSAGFLFIHRRHA